MLDSVLEPIKFLTNGGYLLLEPAIAPHDNFAISLVEKASQHTTHHSQYCYWQKLLEPVIVWLSTDVENDQTSFS
jgi:hypothetical protein